MGAVETKIDTKLVEQKLIKCMCKSLSADGEVLVNGVYLVGSGVVSVTSGVSDECRL